MSIAQPELHFEEGVALDPLVLYPGPLLVGRDATCDRVIPHRKVSKRHAQIERTADGWFITDAGSTNGTFVNGEPCEEPRPLYDGDLVKLGGLHATFYAPDVPPPPAEAPERFRKAAEPAQRPAGPLDVPTRSLRNLASTLWIVAGIGVALFLYLTVLRAVIPTTSSAPTGDALGTEGDDGRG
ncbi:MAG: FHA domain-containing protein [Planctomycetota bacterium]